MKNKIFSVLLLALMPSLANATVTYNTWTSNEAPNGNYILTIDATGGFLNYNLTVNPWNAEALGLFIDMGTADVPVPGSVTLTNVVPTGEVTVFATDTTSDSCGPGCNLQGLSVPLLVGGDWEFVFRLGSAGFDSIQTFSWTTSDFGITESDFGVAGIRAQQLCSGTDLLPGGTSCTGSDKSYDNTPGNGGESEIPEPATLVLLGLGLFGMAVTRRRIF